MSKKFQHIGDFDVEFKTGPMGPMGPMGLFWAVIGYFKEVQKSGHNFIGPPKTVP